MINIVKLKIIIIKEQPISGVNNSGISDSENRNINISNSENNNIFTTNVVNSSIGENHVNQ